MDYSYYDNRIYKEEDLRKMVAELSKRHNAAIEAFITRLQYFLEGGYTYNRKAIKKVFITNEKGVIRWQLHMNYLRKANISFQNIVVMS